MSTGQTEPQVDPRVACFEAILAARCTRHDLSYLVEMGTRFCHQSFSSLSFKAVLFLSLCRARLLCQKGDSTMGRSSLSAQNMGKSLLKLSLRIAHTT